MPTIADYEIVSTIYESRRSTVFRARRISDGRAVALKVFTGPHPPSSEITRRRHERTILQSLDLDAVIRTYGIEEYPDGPVLVLEDFGGQSLDRLIPNQQGKLPDLIRIAIGLTEGLGQLHALNVIHKDVSPANVVYNPESGSLKFIDFELATVGYQEQAAATTAVDLQGTLVYVSPEQTGRTNRLIDYRTDYYSLGATLYHLFCARPPFETTDPLELVHAHIARIPKSPSEVNPEIPQVLSDIVMKLLSKNADDRYQSSFGIKADLQACLRQIEISERIEGFPLAGRDVAEAFRVPQRVYGREPELTMLLNAYDRACTGRTEIILLTGEPGIGKTSLVRELIEPITQRGGHFISGKFDRFQRDAGHAGLVGALREITKQLLMQTDVQLSRWREEFDEAVGRNAAIIRQLIPELELIIGPQPSPSDLSPIESDLRFQLAFKSFVSLFCREDRPLVLFLDDLQWADTSSLRLLELILSDEELRYFLFIGAYRATEGDASFEVAATFGGNGAGSAAIQCVTLKPLELHHITSLVVDAMRRDRDSASLLADLVLQKTCGNPFHVAEFLKSLYAEGLLTLDSGNACWRWDLERIRAHEITDNVVELMAGKIAGMDPEAQEILSLAACLGNPFDGNVLPLLSGRLLEETATCLQEALDRGLVLPVAQSYAGTDLDARSSPEMLAMQYKFCHDRVQQAAYQVIPESNRAIVHRSIGKCLLNRSQAPEQSDDILFITDHLNLAAELADSPAERHELAQLNLIAGKRASASFAYDRAYAYHKVGMQMLAESSWDDDYDLALALYSSAARAALMTGDFAGSDRLAQVVLQKGRSTLDKVTTYETRIHGLLASNKLLEAVNTALEALIQLGAKLPARPGKGHVLIELLATRLRLSKESMKTLASLPPMTDPEKLAAVRILSGVGAAAYMAVPELLPLMVSKILNLSVKHGIAPPTVHALTAFGLIISDAFGRIDEGHEFGELALSITRRMDTEKYATRALFIFNYCVRHWKEHARECVNPLLEAFETGLRYGDVEFAARSGTASHVLSYLLGAPLNDTEQRIAAFCARLRRLKQEPLLQVNQLYRQTILNLMGRSLNPCRLEGESFDEDSILPLFVQAGDKSKIFHLSLNKLMLGYFFEDYRLALEQSEKAQASVEGVKGMYAVAVLNFYDSLARLALLFEGSGSLPRAWMKKVAANQKKMKKWAHHAPMNYLHKFLLVEAELSRVRGKGDRAEECYQKAIELAGANGFVSEQGLANELATRFHVAAKRPEQARAHLLEACSCYERWGACAKVKDLNRRYYSLLAVAGQVRQAIECQDVTATAYADGLPGDLDRAWVLKASQALSDEIVVDKLLNRLMKIVIQAGGAQKGILVLKSRRELVVRAIARAEADGKTVLQSAPVDNCAELSTAIVRYVARTGDSLLLHDPAHEGEFVADPYVLLNNPKSVLCTPLIHRGKLTGILYLENNLSTRTFTPDRCDFLNAICSQAAISLENAQLYAQVQHYARNLEAEVAERTRELRHSNEGLTEEMGRRERVQGELLRAKIEAEAANRAKTAFLANMSHELRTPLNAIIGFSELLEDQWAGKLTEKQTQFVREIWSSGQHLLQLINDILDLAKVEAGRVELEPAPVNMNQLLERCLFMIKEKAMRHDLDLVLEVQEDLRDLEILADEIKLKQIVLNLLSNAAKFTPDGGTIRVEAWRKEDKLVVSVCDTGIGVKKEDHLRIFDAFEQVESLLTRHRQGTGLGLTLTRRFVELHGGQIWVESEGEGRGSTFTFEIPFAEVQERAGLNNPLVSAESAEPGKFPRPLHPNDGVRPTILVVEDNEANMALARTLLEAEGYHVLQARTATDGITIATTTLPALVLMDISLPGMDGLTATGILRKDRRTSHMPIIAMTAHAMAGDEQKALDAGCDAYLAKPFGRGLFLAALDKCLDRSKS